MNDVLTLALASLFGALLGFIYFLGLWETLRRLPILRLAPLWLLVSLVLRVALLLGGLYWVGGGDWRRFVAALVGIILVRLALTRWLGASPAAALPLLSKRNAK